jgi:hypothetical protein
MATFALPSRLPAVDQSIDTAWVALWMPGITTESSWDVVLFLHQASEKPSIGATAPLAPTYRAGKEHVRAAPDRTNVR